MRWLYWFICYLCYLLFRMFYRIEVRGAENIPKGAAIIAPNHVSYLDPPIVGATSPREIHFLANARLFRNRYFGWLIRNLNAHPVNTQSQDTQALKMVLHLLHEGRRVLIFPEGLRSSDGNLKPFKLGCAMLSLHTGAPIIPVYIDGSYAIWPRDQKRPKLKGKLRVTYGPPLFPPKLASGSKKEAQMSLSKELERAILNLKTAH